MSQSCQHKFQHTIRVKKTWLQYCIDCIEPVYKWRTINGKFLRITENDQKVANQHRCKPKIEKCTTMIRAYIQ